MDGPQDKKLPAAAYYLLFSAIGDAFIFYGFFLLSANGAFLDFKVPFLNYLNAFEFSSLAAFSLILGLAVKIPVIPFHFWLLKAHVDMNVFCSIILSGILLKFQPVAIARVTFSAPNSCPSTISQFLFFISVTSIVVGLLKLWYENNIKRVVAISSIIHLNAALLVLSISSSLKSVCTAILLLVVHSISSSFVFFIVSAVSDRYHTYNVNEISGLYNSAPKLSFYFFLSILFMWLFPISLVLNSEFYFFEALSKIGFLKVVLLLFFLSLSLFKFLVVFVKVVCGSTDRVTPVDLIRSEIVVSAIFSALLLLLSFFSAQLLFFISKSFNKYVFVKSARCLETSLAAGKKIAKLLISANY